MFARGCEVPCRLINVALLEIASCRSFFRGVFWDFVILRLFRLTPWAGLWQTLFLTWGGTTPFPLSVLVIVEASLFITVDSLGPSDFSSISSSISSSLRGANLKETCSLSSLRVLIGERSWLGSYCSRFTNGGLRELEGSDFSPDCKASSGIVSSKYGMSTSCNRPDSAFATPSWSNGILSVGKESLFSVDPLLRECPLPSFEFWFPLGVPDSCKDFPSRCGLGDGVWETWELMDFEFGPVCDTGLHSFLCKPLLFLGFRPPWGVAATLSLEKDNLAFADGRAWELFVLWVLVW